METIIEILPVLIMIFCVIFLSTKVKKKGYLFIISLIYLGLSLLCKIISLVWWQSIDFSSMDLYYFIGAISTTINYILMFLIFVYILRNKEVYTMNNKIVDTNGEEKQI